MSAKPRTPTTRAAVCLLLAGALLLGACGGDDGDKSSSTSAKDAAAERAKATAMFRKTFSANKKANSGQVDGNVEIVVTGVKRFSEPVNLSLTGPFQASASGVPKFRFNVNMQLSDGAYGADLTSANGSAYLSLGSTGYKLPPELQARLTEAAKGGKNGLSQALRPFGIAPDRWGKNARIVGVETIDGTKVVHLSGDISVRRFFQDVNRLLAYLTEFRITDIAGLPKSIPPQAVAALVRSTTAARGDIWVGEKDNVLRRAKLTLRFKVKQADRKHVSGVKTAKVTATLNVLEPGEPQRIAAPASTRPFSEASDLLEALGNQIQSDLGG